MIEEGRHWELWQELKRENRVKYNVNLTANVNVPTWKSFKAMQYEKK